MSTLFDAFREARAARDVQAVAGRIPYTAFLGIAFSLDAEDRVTGVMRFAPHIVGNASIPAIHGGAIGSLLESTAIFEVLWRSDLKKLPKTINITIDYLRSARAVDTYCAARIAKDGRRVVIVHVEAWQEDRARPVAAANAHLLVEHGGGTR